MTHAGPPISAETLNRVLADFNANRAVPEDLLKIARNYQRLKTVAEQFALDHSVRVDDLLAAERFFLEYPDLIDDTFRDALNITPCVQLAQLS